jgi:hypothetical protein
MFDAEYVLPLRWSDDAGLLDLSAYLRRISQLLDVTVVDGSADDLFDGHHEAWVPFVRHVRPGDWAGRNGKVRGVMTGLAMARHERVVIADDDVRYATANLASGLARLDRADVVAPQNVFSRWPWHALGYGTAAREPSVRQRLPGHADREARRAVAGRVRRGRAVREPPADANGRGPRRRRGPG